MPSTKKFLSFVKDVEKSNKKFAKASAATKILMVAEDVLKLLSLGRVKAKHGFYFGSKAVSPETLPPEMFTSEEESFGTVEYCQVSDLLKMPSMPTCNVCAIGGAMIASTLRLNDAKVSKDEIAVGLNGYFNDDGGTSNTEEAMSSRAMEVFPLDLLRNMEEAFEEGAYGYGLVERGEPRLKSIYRNLIKNKGRKFTAFGKDDYREVKRGDTVYAV